jgi:hypothetical protein
VVAEQSRISVTYTLADEETGESHNYGKAMAAREEGQRLATEAGLPIEGWRQEQPNVWTLLPGRRWTITLTVNK